MKEPCPGTDLLRGMLLDELPPAEADPIERHVAGCADCQRALEELTRDSHFDAAPSAVRPDPEVSDFLRRMIERRPSSVHRPAVSPGLTINDPRPAAPAPRPSIDGFDILEELGQGGMGVVYRAREVRLGRIVALKMLLPGGHASPEALARFRGEAETVARLQHPHIVQIHSVGDQRGRPFFVMEYIAGGSLAARLDGTPWPAREAAALVEAIARGVEAMHRLGVIHRDLKPGNVLIAADGTPKLGDFGLAKDLAGDSGLTRTDTVIGSPSYMAPEQAEGGARGAGPASDVYSLGAIFYEVLTGRPPFRGASVLETLHQVRTAEPVAPSRLVPGLSRDAETIALKCLEKSPGRRYDSAEALAEDLRRFAGRRPIRARPIGPAGRLMRWASRNPGMAGMAALVLLSLFVVTGVSVAAAIRVAAAADQERRTLYFARMNLTQQAWEASDVTRMQELLQAHRRDARRDFEWYFWWRLAHRSAGRPLGHRREIAALAFSPDGPTLISAGEESSLRLWDTGRFEARAVIPMTCGASSLAVAPDGSTIAVGGNDGVIRVWEDGVREPVRKLGSGRGPVMALAFVDGRTLASAHIPNIDRTWDLRTGRLLREGRGSDLPAPRVQDDHIPAQAISPDGRLVAAAALDGTVLVRPVAGAPARPVPSPPASGPGRGPAGGGRLDAEDSFRAGPLAARSLAFSPDGRLLAVGGEDHLITIRDVDGRRPWTTEPFRGHSASIWSMAFSPDGRLLAAASLDNTVSIWDVASGRLTMTLKGHGGPVRAVAFSPDGQSVASGGGDAMVLLWRVAGGDSDAPLAGHADGVAAVAFSPDGATVTTGGRDGRILSWSAATGERSAGIEPRTASNPAGNPGGIEALVYSNDGRWLASGGRKQALRLWDARTHSLIADLQDEGEGWADVDSLAVSRDDTLLAAGGVDGRVTLWDPARRVPLASYRAADQRITSLSFSPDGRMLASASPAGKIFLRDVAGPPDGRILGRDGSTILTVAFSPDGRTLASGTAEGTLIFWEVASWRPRALQRAHTNQITALAFTAAGRTLISGGRDDMIRLWDVATGELKSTLKGHSGNVLALAMSPDGRSFVSGSLDRTARIWRAASEDDVRRHEAAPTAREGGRSAPRSEGASARDR